MPKGLGFQRKHRKLGYRIKYMYYYVARRELLQKKVSYGNKNIDITVYIIKPDFQDGVEGLLSLIYKQLLYINHAYKKKYIPYVDWKNYKTQYYDGEHNAWNDFFEQPEKISEQEVYKSKNVILSGWTFFDINKNGVFEASVFKNEKLKQESSQIFRKYLRFNKEVLQKVEEEATKLNIEECMGVYLRGTDYVKLKPSGEYVQPSAEQMIEQVKVFLKKYDAPIFLVTEDGSIADKIKETFPDRVRTVSFDSYVRGYEGKDVLSKSNVLDSDKKRRGQDYLVKMILLSRCKYLITSITQGSKFSYLLNDGKYEDEYVFDLGLYP